jgi:hypothetical protein
MPGKGVMDFVSLP